MIPASHPDVDLLDLIAQRVKAVAALRGAEGKANRLLLATIADGLPQLEALTWRRSDFPRASYGRGVSDEEDYDGQRRCREPGAEGLRNPKPPAVWTDGIERRRREIIQAWDSWRAASDAVDGRVGLPTAEAALGDADEAPAALTRAFLATAPATLAGLAAKGRWAAPEGVPGGAVAWRLRQVAGNVGASAVRGVAS